MRDEGGLRLESALSAKVRGEVRFDALARTLYATDAGIYQITPLGVVTPMDTDDVAAAVSICAQHGATIVPRGGGTDLTGSAVGAGVVIDCSKHLCQIGEFNSKRRTIRVGPGVVLDDLNRTLSGHGLHFAPDVATSSRATIGGMIANNSCGARSIKYGRTVDHVASLSMVLGNGSKVSFGATSDARALEIARRLREIRDQYGHEIRARFPRVFRSNAGYGFDRLPEEIQSTDVIKILCGSEGTLGLISEAELRLTPVPPHTGLVVVHFHTLDESLRSVPAILGGKPAAIELVDRTIVKAATRGQQKTLPFLHGDPAALLIVEVDGQSQSGRDDALQNIASILMRDGIGYASPQMVDPIGQQQVWRIRKDGLGLMMSRPGDDQPYSFIEDAAVEPEKLAAYMNRLLAVVAEEGVREIGCYGHASVGCLHVKPYLNLKRGEDVHRLRRIASRAADLAVEFGGTISGEHGDGLTRSEFLEKLYGPTLMQAFAEVKQLFDPGGIMNPGKIVGAPRMDEHLRYGASYRTIPLKTFFDYGDHSGPAGLAGMCSGVGQCRKGQVGTMCPSYMATHDEVHTTRARANALRVALSDGGLLKGLGDEHLAEVMDLCLSCKACKTECPTGVDMAMLKAEWQSYRNQQFGVSRSARFFGEAASWAARGARFPRVSNFLGRSRIVRAWMERRYGLDRRCPTPQFAKQTFRAWFRQRPKTGNPSTRGNVVYLVDTWTNFYQPNVGKSAVKLLEAAGFRVLAPAVECCGRPMISKGLLTDAKRLAKENVQRLEHHISHGWPIVGTEPSCILTYVDEYPRMIRSPQARHLAERCMMIESFLADLLERDPEAIQFRDRPENALYHGHCHQKSIVGTSSAIRLLNHRTSAHCTEINSGCCGMAGSFGHEKDHYDVARAVGDDRLFPAVRNRVKAEIVVSGFSCREQIRHHTGVEPVHVVEWLADALE